jgi:Tol biopolymer transport system component
VSNREDPSSNTFDIYVMNADGTDVLQVTSGVFLNHDSQIAWNPNGVAVAFSARGPERGGCKVTYCNNGVEADIYIKALPCVGACPQAPAEPLTAGSPSDREPAWSPDGSRLVFMRSKTPDGAYRLYELALDASTPKANPVPITRDDLLPSSPAWSPDGRTIAFSTGEAIYTVDQNGDALRNIAEVAQPEPEPVFGNFDPAWSPDGSKIAFTSTRDRADEGDYNTEIYVMNSDGTGQIRLTNHPARDEQPSWQPVFPRLEPSPTGPTLPEGPPGEALGYSCNSSRVTADFDGDGVEDAAVVHPASETLQIPAPPCPSPTQPAEGPYVLEVAWSSGGQASLPLPECDIGCAAYAAADLDNDGTDELFLDVHEGASTIFLEVFALPAGTFDIIEVAHPGDESFPGGAPLRLPFAGSARNFFFVTCGPPNQVIATSAGLSNDQTEWNIAETKFAFDGVAFSIANSTSFTLPAESEIPTTPSPEGDTCWPIQPLSR